MMYGKFVGGVAKKNKHFLTKSKTGNTLEFQTLVYVHIDIPQGIMGRKKNPVNLAQTHQMI